MGGSIFTIKFNMAAEPEALMTSLLLQTETSFQSLNGVTTQAVYT